MQLDGVILINRRSDLARLGVFELQSRRLGFDYERFEAIEPTNSLHISLAKRYLNERHWRPDRVAPGALGCFLSHFFVWKKIARRGGPGAVLVVEDDAELKRNPVEYLAEYGDDWDVMFANRRLNSWSDAGKLHDLAELAPRAVGREFHTGTDGYFVTAAGARKLAGLVERHGFVCEVDWMMIRAGMGPATLEALLKLDLRTIRERRLRRVMLLMPEPERVAHVVVACPALVKQGEIGQESTINPQNTVAIQELMRAARGLP